MADAKYMAEFMLSRAILLFFTANWGEPEQDRIGDNKFSCTPGGTRFCFKCQP